MGLSCGLIVSFSGLTGSLYVWQPEISVLLNPELLQVEQSGDLDEKILLESTVSLMALHQDSIQSVFLPYREQETLSLLFDNGDTRYYHPKTMAFLGEKSNSIVFFEQLLNLHRNLGIPDYGKYIVGSSAILFFLFLLTSGAYIWWKAYGRNWVDGLTIQWNGKKRKFNFDLHKAFGAYFLVPLSIMAITGSYFTYGAYYRSALTLFDGEREERSLDTEQEQFHGDAFQLGDRLLKANETYALWAIHFPKEATGNYRLRYIKERFIEAGLRRTKEVEIDTKGNADILSDFRTDPNSNRIATQFYPVHMGEIIGLGGRILLFLSGMVPSLLFITGINMYRRKGKRSK